MGKSIEQKEKDIRYKAKMEIKNRFYKKQIQLDMKYDKLEDKANDKLMDKKNKELLEAEKKIERQVNNKMSGKIKKLHDNKTKVKKELGPTSSELRSKLLKLVQKYCRLRDSNKNGRGRCISCGAWRHYKSADGGHYISRGYNITAFREDNIHLQCKQCNSKNDCEQVLGGYRRGLDSKYGKGHRQFLEKLKQENPTHTPGVNRMEEKIKEYKIKVNELENQKSPFIYEDTLEDPF